MKWHKKSGKLLADYKLFYYSILKLIFIFSLSLITRFSYLLDFSKIENSNKSKVIATMFAGRKEYIEISWNYIKNLIFHRKLDEMHFWLFTNNNEDREFLKKIGNIHKTSKYFNDYQEIFPQIINNEVEISLKGEGNGFIEINNIIEIVLDAENEETKQYLSSKFPNNLIIFIDNIVNNKEYTSIIIKLKKNGNLIILKDKSLLKTIRTYEKTINSIKVHSGYNKEMFWDYKESKNHGIKLYDTRYRESFKWYEMYEFYLTYNYDILLKIDDDIVFLDLNKYDDFIKYIKNNPNKNFILPNIINTCVSMFYNNKNGLIPDDVLMGYKNKKHPNEIISCWSDVKVADTIHNYFFNNFEKFVNNLNEPISLDGNSPSICFFGINRKNYIHAFKAIAIDNTEGYNTHNFGNDEAYVIHLKGNFLFPSFIVSHYAFSPQRCAGLDKNIIIKYRELSLKYKSISL